jgi:NAD(P)-dependent dehydrogenase (short-subunit alcohol dehydrogenase family)
MASNTRLLGKKGLVVGVANPQSIAAGCARAFHEAGAELAVTYLNEKARPFAQPVGDGVRARIFAPLDVERPGEMTALFDEIQKSWGRLDFLLHSIAFCPKDDLQGRVTDCSREGFLRAMDVSVYSLIRLARLAEPMMADGGAILTVSYYGAEKAVDHYNVMGPVKAALESTVRSPSSSGRRAFVSTPCRPVPFEPGPLRASPISTSSSTRPAAARRNAGWSRSKKSARSRSHWSTRAAAGLPAKSRMSTPGSTPSPDAPSVQLPPAGRPDLTFSSSRRRSARSAARSPSP